MDAADHAQDREAEFLADHLAAQRRAARLDSAGAAFCIDCLEEIPAQRRAALPSAFRCVTCQAWFERVAKNRNAA